MFKKRKSNRAETTKKHKRDTTPEEEDDNLNLIDDDDVESTTSEAGSSFVEEDEIEEEDEETKRTSIRKELSTLTFEELDALKAKLGTKVYNEAMFGTSTTGSSKKNSSKKAMTEKVFKRENHNRPRELSSKVRVPKVREIVHVKKRRHRDPRFENLCGELDEKLWKNNYSFLTEIAEKEHEGLREKLKNKELDDDQALAAKEYLQRITNKEKSDAQKKKLEDKRRSEKEENVQRMKEGKRPYFMKKSTRKYVELAEKYDELKASGKLDSYLKKKRKKNAGRDKKSMKFQRV